MIITYQARLLKKHKLTDAVYLLQFSPPDDSSWTFLPGQYMIFHLPVMEGNHPARRLYSIASRPSQKESLDFVIEIVPQGLGSGFVDKMKEGDTLTMQGPAGLFTLKPTDKRIILFATGTGIAPMISMVEELVHTQNITSPVSLYWGVKYKDDAYLQNRLESLAKTNSNFTFSICLSREKTVSKEYSYYRKGHINEIFSADSKKHGTDPHECEYYLCGGPHVVEALKEELIAHQIPPAQIHFEKFT